MTRPSYRRVMFLTASLLVAVPEIFAVLRPVTARAATMSADGGALGEQLDRSLLDDPLRTEVERQRDAGSRPLEVYEFLGISPGMAVADIMPFGGYNAYLLAKVVGPSGRVVAPYAFNEENVGRLRQRFEAAGLDNAEPMLNLDTVADASLDAVLTVRNVHDWYIPSIEEQFGFEREEIVAAILRTLKPGGVLGVVDARTPEEGINPDTHRINEQFVIDELQAAGFELVERSELLAVPDDDYSEMGFPTRWKEDRMLLKFRKPGQ